MMTVFVATDGTKFNDRNAWRRYEFETNYTFRNKTNETLTKLPSQVNGQPFDLSDLSGCEVRLLDLCDQVQVDNLTNCRVFIGPCSESVFVRNCTNCVFTVACKQLRTRDCVDCSFALYSLTDPIIETSRGMAFAPFNGAYNGIRQHFLDARLEPDNNHWSLVYDFNDPDKSGHNWRLLSPSEAGPPWAVDLSTLVPNAATELGLCVNPVPVDAGYVQYSESGSGTGSTMQSFSFQTSQQEAEKAVVAAATCQAQAPALTLAPPPPAPVQTAGADAPPIPPPAPIQTAENHKVAVIEAAEVLAPPPYPPSVGVGLAKNRSEPGSDAAIDKVADQLQQVVSLDPLMPLPAATTPAS